MKFSLRLRMIAVVAAGLTVAAAVSAQDTESVPAELLTGRYRTDAVFAKYPRSTSSNYNGFGQTNMFDMYVLRGDALVYYNEKVAEGARLDSLVDNPKEQRGLPYRIKTVDPLFSRGGVLYGPTPNFKSLDANPAVVASSPYRAEGGKPVYLDLRFVSTSSRSRLGYFYLTKEAVAELKTRVAESWAANKDAQSVDAGKPFDWYVYNVRKGNAASVNPTLSTLDDLGLGILAAFHAKLIPAFSVASDLANRGYVVASAPPENPDLDVSAINGGNNLGNAWTNYEKYRTVREAIVTGSKFYLKYFGHDYLDQPQANFPEDTYIFPFIVPNNDDVGKVTVDENGYGKLEIGLGNVRMICSTINCYNPYAGTCFDVSNLGDWAAAYEKYKAQPSAFSFPYDYIAYDGTLRHLNLTAFEDGGSPATGGTNNQNYADFVFDVQGVKPISDVPFTTNSMAITAVPVGEVVDGKNHYGHRLLLSAPEGGKLQSRRLGILEIKDDGAGNLTTAPIYTPLNILRTDLDGSPVAYVVFKKYLTDESFETYKSTKKYDDLMTQIDYKVFTAAEYAALAQKDGSPDFGSLTDWVQLQDAYNTFDMEGSDMFQHSEDVLLRNIKGLHDDFDCELSTDAEEYEYSAQLTGYTGFQMTSTNKDKVLIPKSEVLVERGGNVEFAAGANCESLPEVVAGAADRYVSVKVAKDLSMYGKENVNSYTVVDAAGNEVFTIEPGVLDWTVNNGATVLGYDPGEDADAFGWVVVKLPEQAEDVADATQEYSVRINTTRVVDADHIFQAPRKAPGDAAVDAVAGNVYGTPSAAAVAPEALVNFSVTGNEKVYVGKSWMAVYGVRTDWTLDASVNPEGVLFNEWRTYDKMYDTQHDGWQGNILSGNVASTGTVDEGVYGNCIKMQFPSESMDLMADGNRFSKFDALFQTHDADQTENTVNAAYTLRAYIPADRPVHLPAAPAAAPARAAGDAPATRYIMVEKSATLNLTATEADEPLTGIGEIAADGAAPVEYYSLQGIRLVSPQPGQLVIRRHGTRVEKTVMQRR